MSNTLPANDPNKGWDDWPDDVKRSKGDTSDRANASPVVNKHTSGTNTDTWLDELLMDLLHGKGFYKNYPNTPLNPQVITAKQALTTKMELVELEGQIKLLKFLVANYPDEATWLQPILTSCRAELQAHHKQAEGVVHDKLSVRSEDKLDERSA